MGEIAHVDLGRLRAVADSFWGTAADVAVLYPPGRAPLLLAIYVHGATLDGPAIDALHADATRLLVAAAARP